jgi:hypothetical protein
MVRHGLFDGDRWLGPTLVYGVLTVFITAVFAVTVGLTAGTIGGRLGAAVAAAVVAVALAPVRTRVQRLVDRWLYGGLLSQRHPYAGQHRFGRQGAVQQQHHEHVQLQPFSGDDRDEVTEVDLGVAARLVGLRHRHQIPAPISIFRSSTSARIVGWIVDPLSG